MISKERLLSKEITFRDSGEGGGRVALCFNLLKKKKVLPRLEFITMSQCVRERQGKNVDA